MADSTLQAGSVPATSTNVATSLIAMLHTRYDACWDDHNRLDEASFKLRKDVEEERTLGFRYADAMKVVEREADALRLALFYQIPVTWQDALILQYHVNSAADPHLSRTDEEKAAVEVALDTLFSFMCDEVDHEKSGGILQRLELLVSQRRRFRTGQIQEVA